MPEIARDLAILFDQKKDGNGESEVRPSYVANNAARGINSAFTAKRIE